MVVAEEDVTIDEKHCGRFIPAVEAVHREFDSLWSTASFLFIELFVPLLYGNF